VSRQREEHHWIRERVGKAQAERGLMQLYDLFVIALCHEP